MIFFKNCQITNKKTNTEFESLFERDIYTYIKLKTAYDNKTVF